MSNALRVIVCGGRRFNDSRVVFAALDRIHAETPIGVVFHGNARGVDTLADVWGRRAGIRVFAVPAEWAKHGKAAGPKRNQAMLGHRPDMVIAFPGGNGTADMVKRATKAGVKVLRITP